MLDENLQTLSKHDWDWIKKTREELYGTSGMQIPEPSKKQKFSQFNHLFMNVLLLLIIGAEIKLLYLIETSNIGLKYVAPIGGLVIFSCIVKLRYRSSVVKRSPVDLGNVKQS